MQYEIKKLKKPPILKTGTYKIIVISVLGLRTPSRPGSIAVLELNSSTVESNDNNSTIFKRSVFLNDGRCVIRIMG